MKKLYYNRLSPLLSSYLVEVDGDTTPPRVTAFVNALDGSRYPANGVSVDPEFLTERPDAAEADDSPAQSLYGRFLRDFSTESDGIHIVMADFERCSTVCVRDTENSLNVLNVNLYDPKVRDDVRAAVMKLCVGDADVDDVSEAILAAAGLDHPPAPEEAE